MIKIGIVEDDTRYQDLLRMILSSSDKASIVFVAGTCNDIISDVRKFAPDVVIMDINLPGKSGIEGVSEVKKHFPDVKVLMLTVFEDEDKIFSAIKAGADGYAAPISFARFVIFEMPDWFT